MSTYQQVQTKLGERNSRKVGNNTYLERKDNGHIVLRLHATDVLTFRPDGSIEVFSGGWKTPTTKNRISDYVSGLHSKNGEWYWRDGSVFTDGDIVDPEGTPRPQRPKIPVVTRTPVSNPEPITP